MENILNNILQTTNGPYKDYNKYKDNTYDIVSKVAYLIGVPKHIFENEFEPPKLSVYAKMNGDKNARIIRHLCIIRTAIELNFASISDVMKFEYRSILFMPEFVPAESISALSADGVDFYRKSATKLVHHIIDINRLISDRINNCSHLFPLWLKWDYLRELFIMPNGTDENGTKEAAELYYENKNLYPYKMYINWSPSANGNILYNDQKFITLLYQWNYDEFEDFSLLSDAGTHVKNSIYGLSI